MFDANFEKNNDYFRPFDSEYIYGHSPNAPQEGEQEEEGENGDYFDLRYESTTSDLLKIVYRTVLLADAPAEDKMMNLLFMRNPGTYFLSEAILSMSLEQIKTLEEKGFMITSTFSYGDRLEAYT